MPCPRNVWLSAATTVAIILLITAWLREHVFAYPPEVVAAAWDEHVGRSEVVALLARLETDGTIESSLGTARDGATMTLRLKGDRSRLDGYERALIDRLFFHGEQQSDPVSWSIHVSGEIEERKGALEVRVRRQGCMQDTSAARP